MFVNLTKTTLQAFRIGVSYNNEYDFSVISRIIQLFRWMKINVIFEPVEIAGNNYQKQMIYGIDEGNLSHLKKTNMLLHTKFDYSFFNKRTQFLAEEYLDIALKNCFVKTFTSEASELFQTIFFSQNKHYIFNINDYVNCYDNNAKVIDYNDVENIDFYCSFGEEYSIFGLNNSNEKAVINFTIELLNFLKLYDCSEFLRNFNNISEAINELKKTNARDAYIEINSNYFFPKIIWKDIETQIPIKLTETETKLEGKFIVSKLVSMIKERQIKLREEYELNQILCNNIEYYPNINFWDEVVINPIIKLEKREVNQVLY